MNNIQNYEIVAQKSGYPIVCTMHLFTKVCIFMTIIKLISVCSGFSLLSSSISIPISDYELFAELDEPCPENERNPAVLQADNILRKAKNKFVLNGTVHVKETLDGKINVVVESSRCNLLDQTDCHEYDTNGINDVCAKLRLAVYIGFVQKIRPHVECPIRANVYVLSEAIIDASMFVHTSVVSYTWRHTLRFFKDNRKLLFCFKVKIYFETKKKKPHNRNRHSKPRNDTEESSDTNGKEIL